MTSDYVLTIKLDDTQLNRQLAKFKQAFASGGTSSGGGSSTDQIGKFAKFGMIALGVTSIVKMVGKISSLIVDSSPMLKQMLNLFNNELMLMLMPIGNFIGFVLQPILLVLLRYVILPFYRYFMPLAQRYGLQLGDGISRLIIPMLGFFTDPVGSLKGVFDNLPPVTRAIVDALLPGAAITDLLTHLPEVSKAFGDFAKWLNTGILIGITTAGDAISEAFCDVQSAIEVVKNAVYYGIGVAWADITKFFTVLQSDVTGWLKDRWDSITKFFASISSDVTGWVGNAWKTVAGFFSTIGSDISNSALTAWKDLVTFLVWMGTAIGNAWNSLANAVKTLTGGIISPPMWNGSGSNSQTSPTSSSSTQGVGGGRPIGGSPITVHVNVQGNVVTNEDLKKTITSTVQQVMVKYKYGKP